MIIAKLMGGLGNQMFQYAIARNLSLRHNVNLKIDLSFLNNRNMGPNFVYRDYDLSLFEIEPDFDVDFSKKIMVANQPHYHYSQSYMDTVSNLLIDGGSVLLDGYWQSPFFFSEFEEQIRKDFEFINKVENETGEIKEMLELINSKNSVMVNVRRTDYLNTSFHGVMGLDYLNQSKEIIESKVENPHYFIFSDDVEWCRENIKFENMTLVDHRYKGKKFGFYLQLMSKCKHFIIPNSTFAWWAAWSNTDEEKVVIAPKQWFTDNNINTADLIPSNWIRI
jgi:hypothetical protein